MEKHNGEEGRVAGFRILEWLGRKLGRKVHVTLQSLQVRLMMLPRCVFMRDLPLLTQFSMINGLARPEHYVCTGDYCTSRHAGVVGRTRNGSLHDHDDLSLVKRLPGSCFSKSLATAPGESTTDGKVVYRLLSCILRTFCCPCTDS